MKTVDVSGDAFSVTYAPMNKHLLLAIILGLTVPGAKAADSPQAPHFKPTAVTSTGSVIVGGSHISYQAVAGTLVVRAQDSDADATSGDDKSTTAEASMWIHMGACGPVRVLTADHGHTPNL